MPGYFLSFIHRIISRGEGWGHSRVDRTLLWNLKVTKCLELVFFKNSIREFSMGVGLFLCYNCTTGWGRLGAQVNRTKEVMFGLSV